MSNAFAQILQNKCLRAEKNIFGKYFANSSNLYLNNHIPFLNMEAILLFRRFFICFSYASDWCNPFRSVRFNSVSTYNMIQQSSNPSEAIAIATVDKSIHSIVHNVHIQDDAVGELLQDWN